MRIMTIRLALAAVLALGSIQSIQAHPMYGTWSGTWGSYLGVPIPCFPGYPIDPHIVSCIRERGTYHCCPQLYSPYHVRELMPPDVVGKVVLERLTALCIPRKIIPPPPPPELAPKPREEDTKPEDKKPEEKKPEEKKPEEKTSSEKKPEVKVPEDKKVPELAPLPKEADQKAEEKKPDSSISPASNRESKSP